MYSFDDTASWFKIYRSDFTLYVLAPKVHSEKFQILYIIWCLCEFEASKGRLSLLALSLFDDHTTHEKQTTTSFWTCLNTYYWPHVYRYNMVLYSSLTFLIVFKSSVKVLIFGSKLQSASWRAWQRNNIGNYLWTWCGSDPKKKRFLEPLNMSEPSQYSLISASWLLLHR